MITGASRRLAANGRLFIYGPFKRAGQHTAPSNEAFDRSLQLQDPTWGIRDVGALEELAAGNGLQLADIVEMPANNLTLVFELL